MNLSQRALLLSALLLAAQTLGAADNPTWQAKIRAELSHAQKLGSGGAYVFSGGCDWVPVTWNMADVFDAAPKAMVIAFLEQLEVDPAYRRQRNYLKMCVLGLKENDRTRPSMIVYPDASGEWVVYFRVPFLVPALSKRDRNQPNKSPEPTPALSRPLRGRRRASRRRG